jgi:chromosomal replication initiation ATPase DnaA
MIPDSDCAIRRHGRYVIRTYGCAQWLARRGYAIAPRPARAASGRRLLVAEIQAAVAAHFLLPLREMTSARRDRAAARARQVAMYLSRRLTPRSLPEIGRRFGNRDHTTVLHAVRRIERLRGEDAELDQAVAAIEQALAGNGAR